MQSIAPNTVGNGQRQNVPATEEQQPVKPRQRKEKTPKSEIPKIAPEMAKATKVSQTEGDIDVTELVASICSGKASLGESFMGRKAGQHINAAVAARAKVMLGIEPTGKVSEKFWGTIQRETEKFIQSKLDLAVSNYPEVLSVRLNVPTVKIDAKTQKAKDFLWQSRVARGRTAKDLGDERTGINELLRASKDRLEYMTGKRKVNGQYVQPSKTYTREEIEAVENRVKALESRVSELSRAISKANQPAGKAKK